MPWAGASPAQTQDTPTRAVVFPAGALKALLQQNFSLRGSRTQGPWMLWHPGLNLWNRPVAAKGGRGVGVMKGGPAHSQQGQHPWAPEAGWGWGSGITISPQCQPS